MKNYTVQPITYDDARPWIVNKHYAHRMPSIIHAFGLYNGIKIEGVVSYGMTANNNLNQLNGVKTLELNRLCIDSSNNNAASFLIGNSLKMLPKGLIIISYADTEKNHVGYVYQATNWYYTGLGKPDIEYIKGGRQYHRKNLFDRYGTGSVENAVAHGFTPKKVKEKHRYVCFTGTKKHKKNMLSKLPWKILPYPKGETKRYDDSAEFLKQLKLFS